MKIKVFLSILLIVILLTACGSSPADTESTEPGATNAVGSSDTSGSQESADSESSDEAPSVGENADASTDPYTSEAEQTDSTGTPSGGEENPGETVVGTTAPPEKTASYEEQLAALTLFGLSMEYPDFSLSGIYAASAVDLAQKETSKGIYVVFESFGEKLTLHVYPLAGERTDIGTRDLYAAELGYAAFDLVESIPSGTSEIKQEVYSPLLSGLSAIALYTH